MPAMTSPTVENTQPMNRFQRRSFMRSEMRPHTHHGDGAAGIGNHGEPADLHVAVVASDLIICGMKISMPRLAVDDADIVSVPRAAPWIVKRLPQRECAHRLGGAAFGGDPCDEPVALLRGKEFRLLGPIRGARKM